MAKKIERMGLSIRLLLVFLNIFQVLCFNVDVQKNIQQKGKSGSYFGYSIAFLNNDYITIGAPLGENNGKPWGLVQSCESATANTCTQVPEIDKDAPLGGEIRDNQWMGATVYSDNKLTLACAPRYKAIGKDAKTINMYGNCYSYKTNEVKVLKPCEDSTATENVDFCQAGFSAKYQTNSKLFYGLPTVDIKNDGNLSVGRIGMGDRESSKVSLTPDDGVGNDGYMGYSVSSGKIGKNKEIVIIGGTPRSNNLKGRVIMYRDQSAYPLFATYLDDPSKPTQTGTYFGSALATADINGDGFDDLIIGAPYYSDDIQNEGAAYVYLNDKNDNLMLTMPLKQQKGKDRKAGGMFGTAIGSIGDLNKDGYADIAIGAPWGGEDGNGIVYLYYGQPDSTSPLKLMQTIRPKDIGTSVPAGFGYSFAEYYPYGDSTSVKNDFDRNNYPDLAVGAYKSDEVYLFKSRPVITIAGQLKLNNVQRIDLYNKQNLCTLDGKQYKCIKDAEACFTILDATVNEAGVDMVLEMDAERTTAKRAFLVDNGKQVTTLKKNVKATKTGECHKIDIYIKNTTKDVFQNLVTKLSWDYTAQGNCPDVCPIANKLLTNVDSKTVFFAKGCNEDGNDVCSSDLSLSIDSQFFPDYRDGVVVAGETKTITMTVTITNGKENAFFNNLYLEYPGKGTQNFVNVDDAKVVSSDFTGTTIWDADSTREGDKSTLKVTLSSPISKDRPEKVQIKMSINTIPQGTKSLKFRAYVTTESTEVDTDNDSKNVEFPVDLIAGLSAASDVNPEQLTWKAGTTDNRVRGDEIRFRFLFQNLGPSNVDTSEAEIHIPEKFKNDYFFKVYRINLEGSETSSSYGKCDEGGPLADFKVNATTSRRKRRSTDAALMNCGSADISCRIIKCSFTRLSKSESLTVTVLATLVDATFDQIIKESRNITIKSFIKSGAVTKPKDAPRDTSVIYFIVNSPYFTKDESKPLAWWIILLCILAALLIIAIIVFIMYKKGFFKRKKHDEQSEEDAALRRGDPEE